MTKSKSEKFFNSFLWFVVYLLPLFLFLFFISKNNFIFSNVNELINSFILFLPTGFLYDSIYPVLSIFGSGLIVQVLSAYLSYFVLIIFAKVIYKLFAFIFELLDSWLKGGSKW